MPDTPPGLRGTAYPTHLYARCPEFHQCKRCLMCTNFNRHNALCAMCEGTKPGSRHCSCSDAQQEAVIQLETKMGRPWLDHNLDPGRVTYDPVNTSFDQENTRMIRRVAGESE